MEEGGSDEVGPEPEPDQSEDSDEDVEVVQTNVEESGVDPDGFFDDIEESVENEQVGSPFDGVDEAEGSDDEDVEAASTNTSGLADDINSGVARAAVIGLDDEWATETGQTKKKSDLESEFKETFEAFRLGHYGKICAEEYLLVEEDIHPAWGLLGAALICSAVIVYKRPDGDEVIDSVQDKIGNVPSAAAVSGKLGGSDNE